MTPKRVLDIIGAGILLAGLLLAGLAWHNEQVARARLEAELAAGKAAQAELVKQSQAVAETLKERIAALEAVKREVVTPQQIIKEVPDICPRTFLPITTVTEPAAPGAKDQTPVVTGAVVPVEDFRPIFNQLVECQECRAKLEAAGKQQALDGEKLADMMKQRDEAVRVVKGGTFWQRFKHDAKVMGISAGVGVAIGYAVHR